MTVLVKKMLINNKVNITISTTPANATCVISYNGIDYITNSLDVKKGSTVTYTVSCTYYDTVINTVTVNSDEVISVSLSPTEYTFTQPVLSANGTLGGSSFAVKASSEINTNYKAFRAFWTPKSGAYYAWSSAVSSTDKSPYMEWYYQYKLKVTKLTFTNGTNYAGYAPKTVSLYGSDDNSSWVQIGSSYTNSNQNSAGKWNVDYSSNTSFYKYHKCAFTYNRTQVILDFIAITGKYIYV